MAVRIPTLLTQKLAQALEAQALVLCPPPPPVEQKTVRQNPAAKQPLQYSAGPGSATYRQQNVQIFYGQRCLKTKRICFV
jgi:hypothetical protein